MEKINIEIDNKDRIASIEEQCKNNEFLTKEDIELLLKYLCYLVRKKIAEYEGKSIENYSFTNKCDLAQSMICYYLRDIMVAANPVNTNEVLSNVCGHSFVIGTFSTITGKIQFLIDPTYLQFFNKEDCDPRKAVIINNIICISPSPGFFVLENKQESTIMPLIKNGFIELTKEVAKVFGDSFFKTQTGVSPDQASYNVASGSSYIKWFSSYTAKLSKTKDELKEKGLLIEPIDNVVYKNTK